MMPPILLVLRVVDNLARIPAIFDAFDIDGGDATSRASDRSSLIVTRSPVSISGATPRREKLTRGTVLTVTRFGRSPVGATSDLINSPKVLRWRKRMNETELVARLEKLERENRRLKRLGAATLVLVVALGAIYMASCSSLGRRSGTNGVLTAREFDMLDPSGKVRVKIAMDCSIPKSCWPAIDLYDQGEKTRTVIGAGTLGITGEKSNTTLLDSGIEVESISSGGHLGDIANLGVGLGGPGAEVTLSGPAGLSVQLMGQSALPGGEGGVLNLGARTAILSISIQTLP